MKKQAINYSWPVVLSDFSQDSVQENFSRGKLKVFFKGETDDHRYFSDEFSEEIIKSLPYTPVVSNYDEEKDDFVGHAKEQQIFGIVDPCVEPVFEEMEDGNVWCIADVVLYTERPDRVGELAKKIIGQPHSLELDPSSVKYVVNYDEKKHFKNIEFTAGRFVGVSVLGKDQKPAFTGSAFFSCDEKFETKMKVLREYCESKNDQSENGGEDMNLQEFMKLSWGDISAKVGEAICREYEKDAYCYVVDMFSDSAIVRFYYYVEGSCKLMRVHYTCDDSGAVTLGDINEVHMTYEDVIESPDQTTAEINMGQIEVEETSIDAVSDCTETNAETSEDGKSDNFAGTQDEKPEEKEEEEDEGTSSCVSTDEDENDDNNKNNCQTTDEVEDKEEEENKDEENKNFESQTVTDELDPAQVTNVEITPTQSKVSVEDEQTTIQEASTTSPTSFTESEREELETLKREKKVRLVDSYKDTISEEDYNTFSAKVDEYSEESLELELLRAYRRNIIADENKPIRAFAFAPISASNNNESTLDAFVRKNKR